MARVQSTEKAINPAATSITTDAITTTTGNFLCVEITVGSGPGTLASVQDSYTNSWTPATGNPRAPNGQANVYVYWAENITGGAGHTFTANANGSRLMSVSLTELSGRATSSAVLVQTGFLETSSGTSHSSGSSGALSESGCDMVLLAGDNAPAVTGSNITYTPTSSGWSLADPGTVNTVASGHMTSIAMYRENVDTSAQTATWTSSSNSKRAAGVMLAVKAAAGGGSDTPITVDSGSGVGEGQSISLLFDEAFVMPVTNGSGAGEGQEIPFILAQPGSHGEGVGQGQEISLLTPAVIAVDVGEGTGEGQDITLTLASDDVPDAFQFTDVFGTATETEVISAPITVTGINGEAAITVTDGEYSINGGAATALEGVVVEGDLVRAHHTSSANYGTATSTIVTIGGVSDTFTSLTGADPQAASLHGHSASPGGMGRMMSRS